MERFRLKIGFSAIVCLMAIGCNDDNSDREPGRISNDEISLTYDRSLLNSYVQKINTTIELDRLEDAGQGRSIAARSFEIPEFGVQDVILTGSASVDISREDIKYYIPEGELFTGSINYKAGATLYVLGIWGGKNSANVPVHKNGHVIVAPGGEILESATINLNASESRLDNYGTVKYVAGSLDGIINNYSNLVFTKVNLTNGSALTNYCKVTFQEEAHINTTSVVNNSYIVFEQDLNINSPGSLVLSEGSLTDITGGKLSISGKVMNESTIRLARVDIANNVTIGTMKANQAFTGKIDINTASEQIITALKTKVDKEVTFNQNAYIAMEGCNPGRGDGSAICDGSDLVFTLLAKVESPKNMAGKDTLSATDVRINNGLAYVSYHKNDEVYGNAPDGALRIFDVRSQNDPILENQAIFTKAEFNGVDVSDNEIYAVGGNKAGGRLVTAPLVNGLFNNIDLEVFNIYEISGKWGGKNSFKYNNYLWLVSGGPDGGFFQLDPAKDYKDGLQLYNNGTRSKYVVQNSTYQVFFAVDAANGPFLRIANIDGSNAREYDHKDYPGLVQKIIDGKNTLAIDDKYVYAALSDRGVIKVDLATGVLMNHFEPNKALVGDKNVFSKNGATNAVTVNDCYVFLANGADGVIVLRKDNFDVVGRFQLTESTNYVYAKNNLLFVATGRSGLNIIKMTN